MNRLPLILTLGLGWLLISAATAFCQGQGYATAQEAYDIGVTFLRNKNYPKALEALDAALNLKPDQKLTGRIHRALLIPCDELALVDKMLTSLEFIIANPNSPAEKSVARTNLLGFLQTKGKAREAVVRYEGMLQKNAKDPMVLFILSGIYGDVLRDAKKAAELTERLADVTKEAAGKVDLRTSVQLAQQYVKSGKLKEGAEIYEKIAPLDENLRAWHWKEAAVAWLKAKELDRARAAAKAAAAGTPEKRSQLLTHFFHRSLGEVFLETGDFPLAIEHLQKAIDNTTLDGYKKDCQKMLETAKKKMAGA